MKSPSERIKHCGANRLNKKLGPTIFFGSGPLAAKSLSLLMPDIEFEAIITKPATVETMKALAAKIPVFAVQDKQALDQLIKDHHFKSIFAILIDFGIIVSQATIDHFSLGIINCHFSLLPEWRGADPISYAILSGQKQTGVSLMLLVERMDEGPLLAQARYDIPVNITTPVLTTALTQLSVATLKTILPLYLQHQVTPISQEVGKIIGNKTPSYSRKLTKEDGIIQWTKPAIQLEREIRAFIEWPKSRCWLANREVIITQARVNSKQGKPGDVYLKGQQLLIYCGDESLEILRVKPIGKPEMSVKAFLAGYRQFL